MHEVKLHDGNWYPCQIIESYGNRHDVSLRNTTSIAGKTYSAGYYLPGQTEIREHWQKFRKPTRFALDLALRLRMAWAA